MGGDFAMTDTTTLSTPAVEIKATHDARVMAKFAGAAALYLLGPAALCAAEPSSWGAVLASLGLPNVEGDSQPFWVRRLCKTEGSRRRQLQDQEEELDPRSGISLNRVTCADSQAPNGLCEDGGWLGDQDFLLAEARRANGTLLGYDCSDCMTALMRQVAPAPCAPPSRPLPYARPRTGTEPLLAPFFCAR